MHLLLVRHGESSANVAGLYAGTTDSTLTNHGVLQARRLGAHLISQKDIIGPIAHVFASDLQRAYKTAEAITEAQRAASSSPEEPQVEVVQLPELREKDYGLLEGQSYRPRADWRTSTSPAEIATESQGSMMIRVNRFIDVHLMPVLLQHASDESSTVIVAHGIILSVLLRALLIRFPPGLQDRTTEYAAWSNTGVLQAKIAEVNEPTALDSDHISQSSRTGRFAFMVQFVNNLDHLRGLRKTRGGIGSAEFDPRQRSINSFFSSTPKKTTADERETG